MWDFIKSKVLGILIGGVATLLILGVVFVFDTIEMKPKIEALSGTWEGEFESDMSWEDVFKSLDFSFKEVDILRANNLTDKKVSYVDSATFTTDKKFVITSNNDKTKQMTREYLEGAFDVLYANRESLKNTYDVDLSGYTQAQFKEFYAAVYEYDSYELLLSAFVDEIASYYVVQEGTYKIEDDLIVIKDAKYNEEYSMDYKIESEVLYITYSADTDEPLVIAYKRAK